MPRIPDAYIDSVIYLYDSLDAAEGGDPFGGCGVLIGVEAESSPGQCHTYAVTNAHVSDSNRVLRYNSRQGLRSIDLVDARWYSHPDGWDVTVCYLGRHDVIFDDRMTAIRSDSLMTRELIEQIPLRHGDELFMVSRYLGHAGDYDNEPVVRFGTLAKRRPVMIRQDDDNDQESFLAEMRSLPGHSGSPAFLYFSGTQLRLGADDVERLPKAAINFLGIDWGHIPEMIPVVQVDADGTSEETDLYTSDNSGMTCIVPAWRITEVLEREELRNERRRAEKAAANQS